MNKDKPARMSFQKRLAFTFLASVLAFFFGYVMAIHPQLPPRVATHFDAQGDADGWMMKDQYAITVLLTQILLTGTLVLLSMVVHRIPDRFINIPRKKYWLAPQRRQSSLETVSVVLLWIAVVTAAWNFANVHLIDRVNLGNAQNLGVEFWIALAIYLAIVLLLCGYLLVHFLSVDRTSVDRTSVDRTSVDEVE